MENKEQLSWKIVGDPIGHAMTTKEIVDMYAHEYGYYAFEDRRKRESSDVVALDVKWPEKPEIDEQLIDFEYGVIYGKRIMHDDFMAEIAKFGQPKAAEIPSVENIEKIIRDEFHDVSERRKQWTFNAAQAIHNLLTSKGKR